MPAGFHQVEDASTAFKRFFLYGPPKAVKTPLALAFGAWLRTKNPKARTLYIAADPGSENLPSLPDPSWREWIDVWTFNSPLEPEYSPHKDAGIAALANWKKSDPNYELIIWDTLSMTMENILQQAADQEWFQGSKGDKHITFGDPTLPKGHPGRFNIPIPADYNGVNGIAKRLVSCLIAQPMHVIAINHEQEIKDEKGITRIGPSFVGQALTGKLPGWMTGLIYTDKVGEPDPKTGRLVPTLYVCSDTADDKHIAGIRHGPINGDPRNPLPRVKVGPDLVKYWELLMSTLFPQQVEVNK